MSVEWQNIAAIAIVALAVVYVGRGLWRLLRAMNGKSSGGSCGGCGSCSANSVKQQIEIELPAAK
ncbi:MAG: FeoB-associated Cys-rich membrane protein [Planctomycetales bacterium]|nr:FeoB-associated Cys-rich membrane protein [Planctomycetales bacterium]